MSRIRRVLSWVFVRSPAAFYRLAERDSLWLPTGLLAAGGAGAGVGALVGLLAGSPVSDAAFVGAMAAILGSMVWVLLAVLAVGVRWLLGAIRR
ncbi:hypothetical protein ACIBL3_23440 [Kribbella sp. NPDC050124]|uniref:hypothetical protein n=1 Tax=Kribbella sp. NPDC050124 TaxID=3364114 RepID=UPI0037AD6B3D